MREDSTTPAYAFLLVTMMKGTKKKRYMSALTVPSLLTEELQLH